MCGLGNSTRVYITLLVYALGGCILKNFVSGHSGTSPAGRNDPTYRYHQSEGKGNPEQNSNLDGNPKLPMHSKVTRWILFAANPRAVSFFRNPRFAHFSSGRHLIKYFGLGFEGLYPANMEPEVVSNGDGSLERITIPFLLAMLVPEMSPHYATLRKEVTQHTVTYPALWRATRHPSTVMLVVGDEYCLNGLFAKEFSKWSSPVLRTYWTDLKAYVDDSEESAINSTAYDGLKSSRRAESIYVPLGPRMEFDPVGDEERNAWPAIKRPRLFNLLVSLSTNKLRSKIARISQEIYSRAVSESAGLASSSSHSQSLKTVGSRLPGADTALLHNAKFWQRKLPVFKNASADSSDYGALSRDLNNYTGAYHGQNLPAEVYRQALLESVFTICPPGHSPETFRLFEAVEAGSIPIVDGVPDAYRHQLWGSDSHHRDAAHTTQKSTPQRRLKGYPPTGPATATGRCVDPMRPFRESGAPFLWVTDWEVELAPLLSKLREAPQKVLAQQRALAAWYIGFMKNRTVQIEKAFDTHLTLGSHASTVEDPPEIQEPHVPLKNFM